MNSRIIRVQGRGTVSQAPDQIRIQLNVSHRETDFTRAMEGSNSRVELIRAAVRSVGLDPQDLKTVHFDVQNDTEYSGGRSRHIGFIANHRVEIELPIDKLLVGRFLSAVVQGGSKPEVKLTFAESDPEAIKQRVLTNAVENAKKRAEIITAAAGVKLGRIENIEYGYTEIRFSSQPCDMAIESAGPLSDAAPDFEPDDVEAEDTVTITWTLE